MNKVDLHVIKYRADDHAELSPEDKAALVGLLNVDMAMPRGAMSALDAIEYCIESLARIYEGDGERVLEMPRLIGLRQHQRES